MNSFHILYMLVYVVHICYTVPHRKYLIYLVSILINFVQISTVYNLYALFFFDVLFSKPFNVLFISKIGNYMDGSQRFFFIFLLLSLLRIKKVKLEKSSFRQHLFLHFRRNSKRFYQCTTCIFFFIIILKSYFLAALEMLFIEELKKCLGFYMYS